MKTELYFEPNYILNFGPAHNFILIFGFRLYFELWPPLVFGALTPACILSPGLRALASASILSFGLRLYFELWPPLVL